MPLDVNSHRRVSVPDLVPHLRAQLRSKESEPLFKNSALSLYEYIGMILCGCSNYDTILDATDEAAEFNNHEVAVITVKNIFTSKHLSSVLDSLRSLLASVAPFLSLTCDTG